MRCNAKHTKYQPRTREWRCPECGDGADSFIIEESDDVSHDDCHKLHENDFLRCDCGYTASGKDYAALLARKKGLIKCPHCKGTGLIKKVGP